MTHARRTMLATLAAGAAAALRPASAQPAPATIRIATIPSELTTPYTYGVRADSPASSRSCSVTRAAFRSPSWRRRAETADTQSELLVLNDSPLRTAKDFNGKTIAAAAVNDIITLAMKCWMDQNGGDSASFKVVEIPQLSQLAALEAGRVDGITLANPAYTIAMSSGKIRSVANIHAAVAPRYLLALWFSSTAWVAGHRSAGERFARVIADAVGYVNTHVAETVDDVIAETGLDRSLVLRMKRSPQVPNVLASDLQPVIDAAARYKMIDRSHPAAELISDAAVH